MKLVTFRVAGPIGAVNRLGALIDGHQDGRIVDLTAAYAAYLTAETDEPTPEGLAQLRTPPDMIGWLKGGHKSREAAEQAVAYVRRRLDHDRDPLTADGGKLVYAAQAVRLMAPLPRPNSLRDFSIYQEHMMRAGKRTEKQPAWFTTPPFYKGNVETVVGPDDPVPFPYYTKKLDLEIEIAIIIGKKGRDLTFDQARDHIAGYAIWIDPSARDGHDREPFGPTKRKDFCTGLGPCLVTADEINVENLNVKVSVDGETWFTGNTNAPRSFHVEQLVAYASDNEPLFPGNVIGTGTIGYGCAMDYHKWVKVGQTMTFEVEGIGRMTHEIVAGEHLVDHVLGMKGLIEPPAAR